MPTNHSISSLLHPDFIKELWRFGEAPRYRRVPGLWCLKRERASGSTEDGTRRRSRGGALDLPCAPHADGRDRPPGGASPWFWRMAQLSKGQKVACEANWFTICSHN